MLPLFLLGCAACAHQAADLTPNPAPAAEPDPDGSAPDGPTPPPGAAEIDHFDPEASARARSGDFVKCGKRYLDVYTSAPDNATAAHALHNSLACYRAGNAVGAAITSARMLIARFPRSQHAGPALLAIAELSSAIAYFGPAASAYEDYSRKHPKQVDARRGLLRAIRFRKGLGQHAKAVAASARFVELYGVDHPDQAAAVAIAAVDSLEALGDQDQLIAHLRTYLERFGDKTGADREIVVRSALGVALWGKSCGVPTFEGLCAAALATSETPAPVLVQPPAPVIPSPPSACESDPQPMLVPVARDPLLAGQAQAEFRAVTGKLWRDGAAAREITGEDRDQRLEMMVEAVANAKLHLAEPAYEAFLSLRPPAKIAQARSRAQALGMLAAWLRKADQQMAAAVAAYRGAMRLEGWAPQWPIAAAGRTGDLYLHTAALVRGAPLPGFVATGKRAEPRAKAYCQEVEQRLKPLYGEAEKAFDLCYTEGLRRKRFDTGAGHCARVLRRLRPEDFAPVAEVHGAPVRTGAVGDEYKLGRKVWAHRLAQDAGSLQAHYNLAWIAYEELAAAADQTTSRRLAAEVRRHLSSLLAIDHDHVDAWLLYALLELRLARRGQPDSAERLDRSELFLREALERKPKHAPAWNALGLVEVHRNRPGRAARMFDRAVAEDGKLAVASLNAGDQALRNRDFEGARDAFRALLMHKPGNYDARIGYGVALRALGDPAGAERAYLTAQKYSPKGARGEADYNIGVLYAGFRGPAEKDPGRAIGHYRKARDSFKTYLEARNASHDDQIRARGWLKTCDERIRALGAP